MIISKKAYIFVFIVLLLVSYGCQSPPTPVAAEDEMAATATAVPPTTEPTAETGPEPTTPPVVVTVVVTSTPLPSPTETPVQDASEPTATPSPEPEPTETPLPEPTPTTVAIISAPWLNLFNHVRSMAGLTAVPEQYPLTTGSEWHSRYMVVNNTAIAHKEDVNNPLYDEAGNQAAINGNLFATSQTEANYIWGINFWVSAPFHLIPMLNPRLQALGYGDYVEDSGDVKMAAVMDVRSDREGPSDAVEYPIFFPQDGSETWVVRHSLYEWPDPLTSCPGYAVPTGPPIVVQLGDGSIFPSVSSFTLSTGDKVLDACLFDETSYRNPDSYAQKIGRTILDEQDALVILPRQPLAAEAEYTVQLLVNGETYTWRFKTIKRPPSD